MTDPDLLAAVWDRDPEPGDATLDIVVISADRACRLDGLLRSVAVHLALPCRLYVLYATTSRAHERGYDALRRWHRGVRWIAAGATPRQSLAKLVAVIAAGRGRFLLPLADDSVMVRPFADHGLLEQLDSDEEVAAVSLRLGDAAGSPGCPSEVRWAWAESEGPWSRPMSLGGHVYRAADLASLWPELEHAGLTGIEAALARRPLRGRPMLVRGGDTVVARVELAGGGTATDDGPSGPEEEALNQAFLAGFALDLRPLVERPPRADRVSTELHLVPDSRPRRAPVVDPVRDSWRPQRTVATETAAAADGLVIRHGESELRLNSTARVIWELCDGTRTPDQMLARLTDRFEAPRRTLERDLAGTLERLVDAGLVAPVRAASPGASRLRLDLRRIPTFVINCERDVEQRREMVAHLAELGLAAEIVTGITAEPSWIGVALSHLKVLRLSRAQVPFLVLEDDCRFLPPFVPVLDIPAEADAVSLGLSTFGLETPGRFSWGRHGAVRSEPYTKDWIRVFNMLARHAVLYLSPAYQEAIIESQVEALSNRSFPHPGDIGCAIEHAAHIVLAPDQVICRQRDRDSTAIPLRAGARSGSATVASAASSPTVPARPQRRPTDPAVIARCLAHYQEVTEACSDCVVYHLGDRGFFAELTAVARGMIWAWVHGCRFLLDSSAFAFAVERGWEDYFEPFCASPDAVEPAAIRERFDFRRNRQAFDRLKTCQPGNVRIAGLSVGDPVSRGFQDVLGLFTHMIFRPNAAVRAAISELRAGLELPARFAAVHLRRGDKVGDEDLHYPSRLYLDRAEPLAAVDAVFVMSDAHQAVEEVRAELARRGLTLPVVSLTGPEQSGFDIFKLRRGERFLTHGEPAATAPSDRSYLFSAMVQVLAEVSIAARSARFVSTFGSNVGRTVWFLHPRPDDCFLMSPTVVAADRQTAIATAAPAAPPAVEVELLLRGGHRHRLELASGSGELAEVHGLATTTPARAAPPRLVQLPLDGGRSALTFRSHDLLEVTSTTAVAALPEPAPKVADARPGHHPRTNIDEGYLGGYIRSDPEVPELAHGDPNTWAPELWRWAVETLAVASVLDVGCGEGHAARFFRDELGCEVLGIDGSRAARTASVIPDCHVVHDYTTGPFVPVAPFDLVWSCEFVEHVEAQFTHNFLATFAAARVAIIMTFANPGQAGWHHVNLQRQEYWIDRVERLGFRFDQELTAAARRRAGRCQHARRSLVFRRTSRLSNPAGPAARLPHRPRPSRELTVNDWRIAHHDGQDFFLFLDLFVHPSGHRIVAVAPYYDQDWDPAADGIDLARVDLLLGSLEIRGAYLPHRLDSWEPCALLEFSHPDLGGLLEGRDRVEVTVVAGPHRRSFVLDTRPEPPHAVAMSLVVKNENRFIRHFLEYYLACLAVDHVWVYDNGTRARDELLALLGPYQDRGQVTYIPWAYRWRNQQPRKMIAQPPQEAHSLNRFANSRWIGFFDVDELLRIPGRTLPGFLAPFAGAEVDGLSFGLRWFSYRGDGAFDEVGDPPLAYLHRRRDELGRKRQKLVVKAGDVRFLRLHSLEEGRRELPVDDTEIFFHHYTQRPYRFDEHRSAPAERDEYMLRFADQLRLDDRPRRPLTAAQWISHIDAAFTAAEAERSHLSAEVLGLRGMCGLKTRHFYNALCAFDGCRYLEIGSWLGASAAAVTAGNRVEAVCIDNWSQFDGDRGICEATLERFRGASRVRLVEGDCFTLEVSDLGPFDVFLYDGDHRRASHREAVVRFAPTLAELAVLIVDDWNWERVRTGTREALAALDLEVLHQREIILPAGDVADMPRHHGRLTWWNGLAVFLLGRRGGEGERR